MDIRAICNSVCHWIYCMDKCFPEGFLKILVCFPTDILKIWEGLPFVYTLK